MNGFVSTLVRQTFAVLRKELLTEWRQPTRVVGVFFFALACTLMVAFATPESSLLPSIAGGTLWLALLLSSTRSLDQSYAVEHEHGAMEGLLLWPVEPVAVFYGKAIANTLLLFAVAVSLLPFLIAIFAAELKGDLLQFVLVLILGCAGLGAPGTLYGLIASQARGSSVLLPLLMFPVVVPALLIGANATTKLLEGDAMNSAQYWLIGLLVFNLVHWSLDALFYGRLMED
jgi:heme exporter protein B